MIKTALFAAAAALATVATATPTLAKDVSVSYGDLNLASAKGQTTLNNRIHRAAKQVCNFTQEGRVPSQAARTCYKQAMASARTEVATLIEDSRLGG